MYVLEFFFGRQTKFLVLVELTVQEGSHVRVDSQSLWHVRGWSSRAEARTSRGKRGCFKPDGQKASLRR